MKTVFFLILSFTIFFIPAYGQNSPLVMVRCDNDNWEFVKSPSEIDMSAIYATFDPKLDTIVLVHGFLNSYDSAREKYQQCVDLLLPVVGKRNYVGFYWPSDASLDFGTGVKNAKKSGAYLIYILAQMSKWYGNSDRRIHVISKSLGGQALLSTLKKNEGRYVKWGYCFSLAAAVPCDSYLGEYTGANLPPERTWVYYSQKDWILKYLYAIYYWIFGERMQEMPGYENWQVLSLREKIDYLHDLDVRAQRGEMPTGELDHVLYQAIRKAQDAMGLVGASDDGVSKVENVEVTDYVTGHQYWGNTEVMRRLGEILK